MAATAFNFGGKCKRKQQDSGSFGVGKNWGGSASFTANSSGVCFFSAHGRTGYFGVSLNKNGASIATGSQGEYNGNNNGNNNGFDLFYARQYEQATCALAFPIKKGDVITFSCGQQADAGDGTVYWAMSIYA